MTFYKDDMMSLFLRLSYYSLFFYPVLVRYAPCNPVLLEGEALALAAANRSAAFYQMKQYQQAIEDIGNFFHARSVPNLRFEAYLEYLIFIENFCHFLLPRTSERKQSNFISCLTKNVIRKSIP